MNSLLYWMISTISELFGRIIGLGLRASVDAISQSSSRSLDAKFTALGDLTGKTDTEVVGSAGKPDAVQESHGLVYFTWRRDFLVVQIAFYNRVFHSITHYENNIP